MQKNLPCITREHLEEILKKDVFKNRPLPEISDEQWDNSVRLINQHVIPCLANPLYRESNEQTRKEIKRVKQAAKKLKKLEKDARSSLGKLKASTNKINTLVKKCSKFTFYRLFTPNLRVLPRCDLADNYSGDPHIIDPNSEPWIGELTLKDLVRNYCEHPWIEQPILAGIKRDQRDLNQRVKAMQKSGLFRNWTEERIRAYLDPKISGLPYQLYQRWFEQLSELIERINKVLALDPLPWAVLITRCDEELKNLPKRRRRRPETPRNRAIWMLADVYKMLTRKEPGLSSETSGPFFRFVKAIFRHLREAEVYNVNIKDETLAKAIKRSLSPQRKKQSQQRKKQSRLRKQAHTTSPKP
jgi:hypothetical protein